MAEFTLADDSSSHASSLFLPKGVNRSVVQSTLRDASKFLTNTHTVTTGPKEPQIVANEVNIDKKECWASLRDGRKCSNAVKAVGRWTCDIGAHKAQEDDIIQMHTSASLGMQNMEAFPAYQISPFPQRAPSDAPASAPYNQDTDSILMEQDVIQGPGTETFRARPPTSLPQAVARSPPALPVSTKPKQSPKSRDGSSPAPMLLSAPLIRAARAALRPAGAGRSSSSAAADLASEVHRLSEELQQNQQKQHRQAEQPLPQTPLQNATAVARILEVRIATAKKMQADLQQRVKEMEAELAKLNCKQDHGDEMLMGVPVTSEDDGDGVITDDSSESEHTEDTGEESVCL